MEMTTSHQRRILQIQKQGMGLFKYVPTKGEELQVSPLAYYRVYTFCLQFMKWMIRHIFPPHHSA